MTSSASSPSSEDNKRRDRVVENTEGAAVGAAAGAGLATIAFALTPLLGILFPLVPIAGAIVGVIAKELRHRSEKDRAKASSERPQLPPAASAS